MYDPVPGYLDRRLAEVNIAEQKLPFEPSFGWVGRTDYHGHYRPTEEGGHTQDYDQYRLSKI